MSLIFLIGTGATSVRIARKIWEQEFDDGKGGQLLISINIILAILFFPSVFTTKNTAIEERQEVTINVPTSFLDQEGNIVADGKGRYLSIRGGPHDINIKIKISPESRRFEMWEIDPDKDSGFLTEGSHVGTISKDLKTIKAVWTTTGTGEQGELLLEAK